MYELGDGLPAEPIAPGTNVLIAGPPMTGKRNLAYDVLANGVAGGEGTIVVTTKDSADKVISHLSD